MRSMARYAESSCFLSNSAGFGAFRAGVVLVSFDLASDFGLVSALRAVVLRAAAGIRISLCVSDGHRGIDAKVLPPRTKKLAWRGRASHVEKRMAVMHLTASNHGIFRRLTRYQLIYAGAINDDVVLVGQVELVARLLVEHVLFVRTVAQQGDAMLEFRMPGAQSFEPGLGRHRLLLEAIFGIDAELAVIGVETKIAQHGGR